MATRAATQRATTLTIDIDPGLEPAVRALAQLTPRSQELALTLIGQLAQGEGITMSRASSFLGTPAEGIPLWLAKLRQ